MFEKVYLASGSPRRRELLAQIGVPCEVYPVDLDESELFGESPEDYVRRLAIGKAAAGWDLTQEAGKPPLPVIGSDTSVVLDGQTLGKPEDKTHALSMLQSLSGTEHTVMSAVAMQFEGRVECQLSCTAVYFRPLPAELIERYWATGEPADKAGAYGIQGFGAAFVERIEGSYSGVVGLPLMETISLLERFGVTYWHHSE
ncbi:MAG: nucleoside triphosphate pyrophosphatase [Ketobacteraceae bacterium]|nr:nucleoside triphosphate pyrophosphatase [Ketobacteraceae bacterium]